MHNLREQSLVVAAKDQVSCDLAGEAAILGLRDGVYYGLDLVGARVWNLIQEPTTFAALRDALLGEFEVDAANLESDLRELLEQLSKHGLVVVTA